MTDLYNLSDMSSHELRNLASAIDREIKQRAEAWDRYIEYLRGWTDDNADPVYMEEKSPMSFDEFCKLHIDEEA